MEKESLIRDYLAGALHIIEDNLTLVKKEFLLPNAHGTKGFIDILATDVFGNYVIIEIKKDKSSSRQTLQEVLKYVGLVKQNFKAKDSEIRAIILSLDWSELIVPFSELAYQSTLLINGYEIEVKEGGAVTKTKEVLPLNIINGRRQFAYNYDFALFHTRKKCDRYLDKLSGIADKIGLKDFVILGLSAKNLENLPYPFAVMFSFNKLSIEQHLELPAVVKELDLEREDFEDDEAFGDYLEQCLLCAIAKCTKRDSTDVGSPEKLQAILQIEQWQIDSINRFGIFQSDPRLNEQLLLSELKGYNGLSRNQYLGIVDSRQIDRVEEVISNALKPYEWNETWHHDLRQLLQYIAKDRRPFRMCLNVYSPDSIFYALHYFLKYGNTLYLPELLIFVDYYVDNEVNIFEGSLTWNAEIVDDGRFKDFVNDDSESIINKPASMAVRLFNEEVMQHLNLNLATSITRIRSSTKEKPFYFEVSNGSLKKVPAKYKLRLITWAKKNLSLCWWLIELFDSNVATTRT